MVFFSHDQPEVQRLATVLAEAGSPCDVRKEMEVQGAVVRLPEAELWIRNDQDSHRAFLLCVERNAGFARRERKGLALEALSEGLAA